MFGNFDITSWLVDTLYCLPGIIIALSFHEWAHAYAAYRLGDPTARNVGRMTVNPAAHIDPVGIIMLLIVHFGWAKPVPVNPRNFKHPRRDELIVSLAGVVTNILLAFVSMGIWVGLIFAGVENEIVLNIIQYIVVINLSLFVFNLIPIPPLDGYHVLECLLIRKVSYKFFAFIERYGFMLLIAILIINSRVGLLSSVVSWFYGIFLDFFLMIAGLF